MSNEKTDQLPTVKEVRVLRVQEGDALILKLPLDSSREEGREALEAFRKVLPLHMWDRIVLTNIALEVRVARTEGES